VVRKGVTVNTISPGYIGTRMVMGSLRTCLIQRLSRRYRWGGWANLKKSLALWRIWPSEEAAFLTGANIAINGGQHMQ